MFMRKLILDRFPFFYFKNEYTQPPVSGEGD